MNSILNFLEQNWQRLGLDPSISPDQMTCLILTPRFRASNHLIGLVMPKAKAEPILVVKIPRQVEASGLAREAANLLAIQKCRDGGFPSVPRLLAYESFQDRSILVETALLGRSMDPALIRKDLITCCDRALTWIVYLHQCTKFSNQTDQDWFTRLIDRPLDYFREYFPLNPEEKELIKNTRSLVERLQEFNLPLVFEHGDMSHPNLLLINDNQLGVLDWELANANGLPYCDLFFFLNYAAISRKRVKSLSDYLAAFQAAFYSRNSWTVPYMKLYGEKLSVPSSAASILFVLCWARYSIGLLERMLGEQPYQYVNGNTATWLRSNRYYSLWQYSVNHFREFTLS